MQKSVLGYFEKTMARRFKEALEDDGVTPSLENVRTPQNAVKVKISVDPNDHTRSLELVKKLEIQYLMLARKKAEAFERKAITVFLVFAFIFVAYIIFSNL